jgi:hypothetical protein
VTGLGDRPRTAEEHFGLLFYAAVLRVRERTPGADGLLPFLGGYYAQLDEAGADDLAGWLADVQVWAAAAAEPLPAARLAGAASLTPGDLALLFHAGLIHEDARFAAIPLVAEDPGERAGLRRLARAGLVERAETPDRAHLVPPLLWDALRGGRAERPADWLRFRPLEALTPLDELIGPAGLLDATRRVPAALGSGAAQALIVRGPAASGRRTVVGAVARELGAGVLEVAAPPGDGRWRVVGPLASVLGAMPVAVLDMEPGALADVPALSAHAGPLAAVADRHGGVGGALEGAVTLTLGLPGAAERARHWRAVLGTEPDGATDLRMTGGNIRRAARLARAEAAVAGSASVGAVHVRRATRALHARLLDGLAERLPAEGGWELLAVTEDTRHELRMLERRCRRREQLADRAAAGPGLRALLTGPSGTGKTLAARLLAATLGRDLYRLDVASVVDKYLGQTEKNLGRALARAEEADVVLLLDEGDALLGRRTGVQTSNDRYANLETNYLLQRLETFEGVIVVTTNAYERVDPAFRRRLDVVVEFRPPDAWERLAIWRLHLGADHLVAGEALEEISSACELTGGEIRNCAVHASLLALEDGGRVTTEHLLDAVRREFRKSGAPLPLAGRQVRG